MLNSVVLEFFEKRKINWIESKITRQMTEEEIKKIKQAGEEKFSLDTWLPDAAKRAGQVKFTTHPCTFSHPSSRKNNNGYVTSVIAKKSYSKDGFLRTGNVRTELEIDALGNAAALDVHAFVSLKMEDGKTLLEHIDENSVVAKEVLSIATESYESLRNGFLAMKHTIEKQQITSSKIKQIYFPINNKEYHLLSILTNSQNIFEMRIRTDKMRFSDENTDLAKKRKENIYSDKGYKEITNLTEIRYGGANPQNISVLNTAFQGRAFLLPSIPPLIQKRNIPFPRRNFFLESIRIYHIKDSLERLDKLMKLDSNLMIPKKNFEKARDNCFEEILDQVIFRMNKVREVSLEQYFEKTSLLPQYQKTWLLDIDKEKRETENDWLKELISNMSLWIISGYNNVIKKPLMLGSVERNYIEHFFEENQEALK
jgi:CRISPR-associated protein Csy1